MHKLSLILLAIACLSAVYPVTSVSRWFSSTFHDLRHTLRRYGHCVGDLAPLKTDDKNETDFLIYQIREFLNQGSFDNEQLANVSALMDNICRSDERSYPISVHIDVSNYNASGRAGKEKRCQAIDESLDAMFPVFKRALYNKSEPLDFSVVQFYPHPENTTKTYNLTDLINTSWISSETVLENVCKITDSVKDYVRTRAKNYTAQDRIQQTGVFNTVLDIIDRILEPILGLERRFYWESSNLFQQARSGITNQFGNLRGVLESGVSSIINRVRPARNSSLSANSTAANLATVQLKPTSVPVQPNSLTEPMNKSNVSRF